MDDTYWNKAYASLNTKCPKCKGLFDSSTIKVKKIVPYYFGTYDILVFDCPCCGEEISDIQCEGIEQNEIPPMARIKQMTQEAMEGKGLTLEDIKKIIWE